MKCTISENILNRDLKSEILEYLRGKPGGVIIKEISRQIGSSRNTVLESISILIKKKKIFSKKIGKYRLYFSTKTRRNPEEEILEYIRGTQNGVTITEIHKKKGFSRNTVSKYINILALKEKIFSRKIGTYHLFFSTESNFFSKVFYISFYKGLLASLKEKHPNDGEIFKEVGRNCLKYIDFSFDGVISKELKGFNFNRFLKLFNQVFGKLNLTFEIPDQNIELSVRKKGENSIVTMIKIKNPNNFLNTDEFIYHFYILAGIFEGIWKREANEDIICNVETIHVADNKADSFIELSIESKSNK